MMNTFRSQDERKRHRYVRPSHHIPDTARQTTEIDWGRVDEDSNPNEKRNPPQKDLDAVLYSYYTRRLAKITQVNSETRAAGCAFLGPHQTYSLSHNRLTHSLKVGQVARRMVQYLHLGENNRNGITVAGGLEADIAELAGRAHDLGHPPFGHLGEIVLQRLAEKWGLPDGFEGNAQTFRILVTLQKKLRNDGLVPMDLTNVAVASVVKYPWLRARKEDLESCDSSTERQTLAKRRKKYNVYDIDRSSFITQVEPLLYSPNHGTLEAQVMDWCDDISYATHDIEDFVLHGLIPLEAITRGMRDAGSSSGSKSASGEAKKFYEYCMSRLVNNGNDGIKLQAFLGGWNLFHEVISQGFISNAERGINLRYILSAFVSDVITRTSKATTVDPNTGLLKIDTNAKVLIEILKSLTWFYVIRNPATVMRQKGEEKVLESVAIQIHELATKAFPPDCDDTATPSNISADEQMESLNAVDPELVEHINQVMQFYCKSEDPEIATLSTEEKNRRAIARGTLDYIAGLTEDEVYALHSLLGPTCSCKC